MKFSKNKKTFLISLTLVAFFHIAVININYFRIEKNRARGGLVHNIYLGHGLGGPAGKGGSTSLEKERRVAAKKTTVPKPRFSPKLEAKGPKKSLEELNLEEWSDKEPLSPHALGDVAGSGGRGGTDGYGDGSYGGGMSLEQIRLAYLNALKIEIEKNKEYLTIVKNSDEIGIVGISFIILKDGAIINVKLRKRSKYPSLNILALKLISKLKRFRPIPYELKMDRWKIDVDIEYKLGG
ncbi:MAG: energy transducer TonB [Proteobacteria bacterium]|nr:energy transducer TonB [Pseudomonadota bacterium]